MSSRRNFVKFGLSAAALPTGFAAMGSVNPSGPVTSSDYRNGAMKGFVLGSVLSHDAEYYDALAATGARVGRVSFPFRKYKHSDKYVCAFVDIEAIKRNLDLAYARGIRLVVCGIFPESEEGRFWTNVSLRNSFVENWRQLVRVIGAHPAIAGFDLLNEPNPPWPSGNLSEAHGHWRPLAEQAIAAIRLEGVVRPVIYEGVAGGTSQGLRDFVPFTDPQVVYSIHHYDPLPITHQKVSALWPKTIPYPAGIEWGLGGWDPEIGVGPWNRERMEISLRDTINFQKKYDVPIFVGEFGCIRWAPNGSRLRYIADSLWIFKKFGWSWSSHAFRSWPGWDAEISSEDSRITERTPDSPVMNLLISAMRTVN